MPMQPRPWRDTVSPWLPSSIISMSWVPLIWAGRPPRPPYGSARPADTSPPGVAHDLGRADEHGAAALRRHDPVELGPVLVRATGGLEDGPDQLRDTESEVRPVIGSDE